MPLAPALFATVAGLGGAHLWAYYRGWPRLAGVLKAAPVLALAAATLAVGLDGGRGYAILIAIGLGWSAVGDVCLLRPDRFLVGVASFGAAHVSYLVAFAAAGPRIAPALGWLLALGTGAACLSAVLWPRLHGRLRAAVALYVALLTAMAWAAVSRAATPGVDPASGIAAAVGAVLFLGSDALLALDRFVRRLPAAHAWVMVTYYAAQTAIAVSV